MGQQLFLETLCSQGLPASPAAGITDDFLVAMIERHRGSVGLDNEMLAHQMRWGAVTIAVELQANVLLHQGFGGVAVIGSKGRQGPEAIGTEAVARALAGLTVQALVGDLIQPLPDLAIDIRKVSKLAKGPEVLADVTDATAFHLPLLPASGGIAGPGVEATLASEPQEAGVEANQGADVLSDYSQKIVIPAFASDATQSLKPVQVAADEGVEALAVGELDIEHPAVPLDQAEGIQFSFVPGIVHNAEVTPINLEAISGRGLHAHEGAGRMQRAPQFTDAGPQDGDAAIVTQRPETLQDDHGTGTGVLLKQAGYDWFEGIDLAGPRSASRGLHRRVDVLPNRPAGQMHVTGDLPHRPVLPVVQPVDFVDAVGIEHGSFVRQHG
jgi:hypothetical protein